MTRTYVNMEVIAEEHKVFFVILENFRYNARPFAITIYRDYCYEDLYATILEELNRQTNGQMLFDIMGESLLMIDGKFLRPEELAYESFKNHHVHKIRIVGDGHYGNAF